MKIAAFIIIICCIFSCKNKDDAPSGILKFDKMRAVLWDVIQAEAFTAQLKKKDSILNAALENLKMQQQIFSEHQTNKEEFYKSYHYYSGHIQLMRTLLDSITTMAERNKYQNLYKPLVPQKISLMPLPPPLPPVVIPMPIPTLNSIQTLIQDTSTIRKRIVKSER